MRYKTPQKIIWQEWNNALSFEQRKQSDSACELIVPQLKFCKNPESLLDTICIGKDITFEEYINNTVCWFVWLQDLLWTSISHKKNPQNTHLYVVDNHNHAFYMWAHYQKLTQSVQNPKPILIHIDQHSDMALPQSRFEWDFADLEQVASYTNNVLQVGNFIHPAQKLWLFEQTIQCRTEYGCLNFFAKYKDVLDSQIPIFLDIDLDFWAPGMSIQKHTETIKIVRSLIALPQTRCITIATSPYFLDQQLAKNLLAQLLQLL